MSEDIEAVHREAHAKYGTTMEIWFPPETPWDELGAVEDAVVDLVYGWEREDWDALITGHRSNQSTLAGRYQPGHNKEG